MSDIEKIIAGSPGYERFWSLIADKNQRIAQLGTQLAEHAQANSKLVQRITELERHLPSVEDIQSIYAGVSKDQRIAELEAQAADNAIAYGLLFGKNEAMAALLDRVPHEYLDDQPPDQPLRCWTDCPACAWAKLILNDEADKLEGK